MRQDSGGYFTRKTGSKDRNHRRPLISHFNRLLTVSLLMILVEWGIPWNRAKAQNTPDPTQKLSPALRHALDDNASLIWENSPAGTVRVILQTNGAVSNSLISAVTQQGGLIIRQFNSINGVLLDMPKTSLLNVAALPDVDRVSADHLVKSSSSHLEAATGADLLRSYQPHPGTFDGLDGSKIGIAILDSGIMTAHQDFADFHGSSRVTAGIDIVSSNLLLSQFEKQKGIPRPFLTGEADDYGHGSFVAGVAAGRDLPSGGSTGFQGIAPSADLIDVRVLDGLGLGQVSDVIAGIDWIIQNHTLHNLKVINLSLAASSVESWVTDPLCRTVRNAEAQGITVVCAAGNYGETADGLEQYGSIGAPGNDPTVITVGAANTKQTDQRSDDSVTAFSSRGPTRGYSTDPAGVKDYDNLLKPDLLAPGNRIVSAESTNNYLVSTYPQLHESGSPPAAFMQLSGTSVAAPVVSGAVALMLQRNPGLTPPLIKAILQYTAQQVPGANIVQQGAGLLNIEGATRLAGALRTDISSAAGRGTLKVGDPILAAGAALPAPSSTIAGQTTPWG
ncbi:MAG: S8 family serine peptidase, partial [Blastocatellia bacterium]